MHHRLTLAWLLLQSSALAAGRLKATVTHAPARPPLHAWDVCSAHPATRLIPLSPAELTARSLDDVRRNVLHRRACPSSSDTNCGDGYCCPFPFKCEGQNEQLLCFAVQQSAHTPVSATPISNAFATHHSASSSSAMAPARSLSVSTSASSVSASPSTHASSGLSGGAIAGIVIGILLAVALLAAAAFLLLRRRKRAAAALPTPSPPALPAASPSRRPPFDEKPLPHTPPQITEEKQAVVPTTLPLPPAVADGGPVEAGGREIKVDRHELPAPAAPLMQWPEVENPQPQVELEAGRDAPVVERRPTPELPG